MQFFPEALPYDLSRIYELSARSSVLDFQELLRNRREKGFQHFFLDLVKEPETRSPDFDPTLRRGWILKGGLLIVHEHCDSHYLMDFLETKLGHYPWFETRVRKAERLLAGEQIDPPTLPAGFEAYTQSYKTLGQFGPNKAIDVIAFIQNDDGTLAVQVIVRPFDKKYAFVGGIIEQKEATLARCFDETLEEFYSNDLFVRNSGTELLAKRVPLSEIMQAFEKILNQKEFATLKPVLSEIMTEASRGTDFPRRLESLRRQLLSYASRPILQGNGKDHTHRLEDLEHLFVRLRCLLYKEICPVQHERFIEFLRSHLVEMPMTTNESDPRNTNEAYMVTVPHWLCVSHKEMVELERDCAIKPKGGDDAVSTNIVPLEKLYEQSMYAAHGRINLEALVDLLGRRPDLLSSHGLQAQLASVEANIIARESASLGLNAALGITPMQCSARGKAQLPSLQTSAQVEQLSQVVHASSAQSTHRLSQPITMVDTVQRARDELIGKLGAVRFARIEGKMEDLHIPASALVAIADASTLEKAVVIIDNSGSTTGMMRFIDDDGQTRTTSRWEQEHLRIRSLLPLLAFAGIQVEFRFLNPAAYHFSLTADSRLDTSRPRDRLAQGQAKLFDFRVKRNHLGQVLDGDVAALEHEFGQASTFVESIFAGIPSGATYLKPAIESTLNEIKKDGLRRGFFFITDGELNDKLEIQRLLMEREHPELSPMMVSACTDNSAEIRWARELQTNTDYYVGMLEDYTEQSRRIEEAHVIVPYPRSLWVALHIALPKAVRDDLVHQGIFLYLKADILSHALTQSEISEMVGYAITDAQYAMYVAARQPALDTQQLSVDAQIARQRMLINPPVASAISVSATSSKMYAGGAVPSVAQAGIYGAGFQGRSVSSSLPESSPAPSLFGSSGHK